jgi:hypothetical protein
MQPQFLIDYCKSSISAVPSKIFFNSSEYTALREAYVIGKFGLFIGAHGVKINRACDEPPDGSVRLGADINGVEIVEFLKPGRRRGEEYKNDIDWWEWDDIDRDISVELMRDFFAKIIKNKSGKKYTIPKGNIFLVIYFNWDCDIELSQLDLALQHALKTEPVNFKKVYIVGEKFLIP